MSSQPPESTTLNFTSSVLTSECLFEYPKIAGNHDIRLLRLEASTSYPRQGRITGRLRDVSLDESANGNTGAPRYHAISYCWGDPLPTDCIWLSENAYLPINASAAQVIRNVGGDIDIWIDAVCINQRDNDEKSRQVTMMWDIYKFAEVVVAWLGGLEDDAKLAMQLIFDAANPFVAHYHRVRKPVYLPTRQVTPASLSFHFDALAWGAFAKLLERPWFRRIWIIQEIVAAGKTILVCSPISDIEVVDWEDLVKVIKHLEFEDYLNLLELKDSSRPWAHSRLPHGVEGIMRIEELKRAQDTYRKSMQEILMLTATAEASDPRDKVWAIRSVSRERLVEALRPNYHLSACEAFANATRHMITHDERRIEVLHMAGIGWTRWQKDLPSWVPDYSCPRHSQNTMNSTLILGHIAYRAFYRAGNHYSWDLPAIVRAGQFDPHLVTITGLFVNKIVKVCHGLPATRSIWNSLTVGTYSDRKEVLSLFNNIRNNICPSLIPGTAYLNGKAVHTSWTFDALWCTLIVGIDHQNREISHHQTDGRKLFDAFLALLLHTVSSQDDNPKIETFDRQLLEKARSYVQVLDKLSDWTVFQTSQGYVGRGPPFLQKGDHICVFRGGDTPFVIRKASSLLFGMLYNHIYRLVGECYVEGLMKKEALYDASDPRSWSPINLK
jgi:Heterokaryon incompatibility protein (HET)